MTAEIAILNKTAVALAADSAVTISAGSNQQKIYDSEDKLFELSCKNPIGVMVNNTLDFMEAPLSVLIKKYREEAPEFKTVRSAASHFLAFLNDFIGKSPVRIQNDSVVDAAIRLFELIHKRSDVDVSSRIFEPDSQNLRQEIREDIDSFPAKILQFWSEAYDRQLNLFERIYKSLPEAQFIGDGVPSLSDAQRQLAREKAADRLIRASEEQCERAVDLLQGVMRKRGAEENSTGLIVAGFGSDELFPTLISFELYGAFGGRLRFRETDQIDIDRDGVRARVLPFAQREMVERFLYGLDDGIERKISAESRSTVSHISDRILSALDMPEGDLVSLRETVAEAEQAYNDGLNETFGAIRADSRMEVEDMVEFMPKPEMARMAEALVNLTSIKRRVSRGHETVGGPIDVAVISRAEGFVWVSRKHYFPPELNERFFARMRSQA